MSQPPDTPDWLSDWSTQPQTQTQTQTLPHTTASYRRSTGGEVDRVWVHLVWELVLVGAVVGAAIALVAADGSLSGQPLGALLVQAAGLGLIASGLSCSMRAAVPNLAVGAIAAAAAIVLDRLQGEESWPLLVGMLGVLFAAALFGVLLGAVVVVLHVPGWVASLACIPLLAAGMLVFAGERTPQSPAPIDHPVLVFTVFALVSVLGGVACAAPRLRWWFGGRRGNGSDPGRRATGTTGASLLALTLSAMLAAAGGMVLGGALSPAVAAAVAAPQPAGGIGLTLLALAAVLVGGVSAFGRRGGVFGTLLGVVLVVLLVQLSLQPGVGTWVYLALPGGLVVAGLVVNRLLEATGRRTLP